MLMEKYKSLIYYRLYKGRKKVYEQIPVPNGEPTQGKFLGYEAEYSDPIPFRIHVGWARGAADNEIFGSNLDYDKPMVTNWLECPIDEDSVLIVDHDPSEVPYDYIVKRVAKSKNYITYAIKKVNVSGN